MIQQETFKRDASGQPEQTVTGVRCGNHDRARVRHADVAAVLACFQWTQEAEEVASQMAEETYAEGAWLRHAENANAWEYDQERRMEDARGVIQFDDAYRAACPEAFQCNGCGTPDTQVCPETCPERKAEELQEAFANRC